MSQLYQQFSFRIINAHELKSNMATFDVYISLITGGFQEILNIKNRTFTTQIQYTKQKYTKSAFSALSAFSGSVNSEDATSAFTDITVFKEISI